jgi:hypothetical protein
VRPDAIATIGIGPQDFAQMRLAKYDHIVEAFAPNRSDFNFSDINFSWHEN